MKTRSGVFAVAITVLLLMALTMNSVSAESKAKVKLGPTDADKMKLNHTDAAKENLNHTNVAREELNHTDAAREKPNHTDVAKEKLNHSDAAKENLNHTDVAKVALNPSESMPFPTERAVNELIYDDGTAEDAYAWSSAGNGFAVRFTPPTYPVDLLTARICFWPDGPDSDHEEFAVYVYDDDGPGGKPGTRLGDPIYHTATAWGWCDVDISGLGISIGTGDFYILYKQLKDLPDCEGLCVDKSLPKCGRSWDYVGGSWDFWNENYMIRCVVDDDTTDEWTFMVYLDGDNNLEGAGIDDFMEMSSVGSTSDVNIVVQFDRIAGYSSAYDDWKTCKRFLVTSGMTPMPVNAISDLGECNMGDPNTLDAFVTWAMTDFPADNYALILWNHGDGWKSINDWVPWADDLKDAKDAGSSRGICVDNTDNDYLSLQETEVALTGKSVQLLGYDACLMHMIEVVYQVMANADVSVGSEEVEPWDGWPYAMILTDLTGTPTMNEDALGTVIVDRYMASYGYTGSETQSAVTNALLPGLATAVDNLAQVLINEINGGHWTQVQQARYAAEEIYYNYYIDLYHFAEKIPLYVPSAAAQAQAVMVAVSGSVYEAHGSSVPNDHGLSIYYPRVEGDYLASYDSTAFASATQWNEFLKRYYEGPELVCEGTATSCGIYPNCENCNEDDGCYVYDDGCEERDYYCISNEEGCDYTPSNRHTDGWVDTGNKKWVNVNECQEKEQKEQEYRDYCCSGGACTYSEGGTKWVDTGTTRNKDDETICGCTARNTLKRCYSGVCTDTGICDATTCGADAACDGKVPGDSCGGGGICDSNCKCGGQAVGEDYGIFSAPLWFVDKNGDHIADDVFGYGFAGATPLVGDFNQDGKDDIAVVYLPWWFVDTNGDHIADETFAYGFAGGTPLVGDFNQDGKDDIAVVSLPTWFVDTDRDQVADDVFGYGFAGATPMVGDFNQDGKDDIAVVYLPWWFVDTDRDQVADDTFGYGFAGATPMVGDFNQDGSDDIAVVDLPIWFVDTDRDQVADDTFGYGFAGATPIVGNFG